jgi:hypothetical protein
MSHEALISGQQILLNGGRRPLTLGLHLLMKKKEKAACQSKILFVPISWFFLTIFATA